MPVLLVLLQPFAGLNFVMETEMTRTGTLLLSAQAPVWFQFTSNLPTRYFTSFSRFALAHSPPGFRIHQGHRSPWRTDWRPCIWSKFYETRECWRGLSPRMVLGYVGHVDSFAKSEISPDSGLLTRLSPPVSGLNPYICRGVHFCEKGESLITTFTESHTVCVFCYLY